MAKNKLTLADLPIIVANIPIIRSFLDLFEGEEVKSPKERAIPFYKIYNAVDKQLALVGAVDYEQGGYCKDVYVDQTGIFALAGKNDDKLYKAAVTVSENDDVLIGEWIEVVADFKPVVGRTSGGISIERQANGDVRWYAWPACTAALNRSGEIDSRKLFDSFVENVERTGQYPELDFFHLGQDGLLGIADNVLRDEFTYCATGLFYDTDLARSAIAEIEGNPQFYGNSIQYYPSEAPEMLVTEDGAEIPVFNAGVNRYISVLPEHTAAAYLTSITTTKGVDRMISKETKDKLKKSGVSATMIAALEKQSREVNVELQDSITRQKAVPTPAAKTAKPAAAATPTPATSVKRDALVLQAKALLKDPEFRDVLRDVIGEIAVAPAAEAEGEEAEELLEGEEADEVEETPVAAAAAVTDAESTDRAVRIEAKLDQLLDRLDQEDEDAEEEVREILADLPSKVGKTKIIRPRTSRNTANETTPKSMEREATNTLSRIREARVS